jgi:hypothetical protein
MANPWEEYAGNEGPWSDYSKTTATTEAAPAVPKEVKPAWSVKDIVTSPMTDIPALKQASEFVRGEEVPTTAEPSFMRDVALKTGRDFAADMIPTTPLGVGFTALAGPITKGVVKGIGAGLNKIIPHFAEEKAAAVAAKAAADTATHTKALDQATEMVASKRISKDVVDKAYEDVAKLGNPRIDAKPYADRIKNLIDREIQLPKNEQNKSLLKTLREDLKTIKDNEGTLTLREMKARVERYGAKGYGTDSATSGPYRTLQGGVHEALDIAETTGKGMTPAQIDAFRAARTLHKQKLGADELGDILKASTKESEKLGIPTLNRSGMIDRINKNDQIAKSFSKVERDDMVKVLREIELPKLPAPGMNPLLKGAIVGGAEVAATGVAVYGANKAGLTNPKTIEGAGATAAVALLLSTQKGRNILRRMAKGANGPIPSNVLMSGAAALSGEAGSLAVGQKETQ